MANDATPSTVMIILCNMPDLDVAKGSPFGVLLLSGGDAVLLLSIYLLVCFPEFTLLVARHYPGWNENFNTPFLINIEKGIEKWRAMRVIRTPERGCDDLEERA